MRTVIVAALVFVVCAPVAFGQTAVPLEQAVKDGKVDAEISGIGGSTGDAILIAVRRKIPGVLRLTLTPGTVFKSTSGTVQNMAGASIKGERVGENSYRPTSEIVLADDEKHSYVVEAYCLDFHKPNPGSSDAFTITPADERATKILQAGKNKSASIAAIQSALWMQREHLTPAEVKQRFPASDEDIAVARAIVQSQATTPQDSPGLPVPVESKPNGRAEADAQLWSWLEQKGRFYDVHERKEVLVGDSLKIPKIIARFEKPLPEKAVADQFGRPTDEQKVSPDSATFFLSTGGRVMPGEKVCRYGNVALLIDAGQVVQAAKFGNDSIAEADRRQMRNQAATQANAAARIIADQKLAKWKSEFESLRKFAEAGFPGFIDAADSKPPANREPGPSIEYIVKTYGPPDRIETRTSQVSGRTRQLYWYGGLAVIASKEDGLIWGFGGKSPKSGPTAIPNTGMRKWTDSTGTHTIEAEFVDFKDGKVQLKKEDGKTVAIPIEKLSKEDQEFAKSQVANAQFSKAERQALVLLGNCTNWQMTARSAGPKITGDEVALMVSDGETANQTRKILLRHKVADALSEAVGYLASREPKGRIQELLVFCSKNPAIGAIKEVLGDEKSRDKRGVLIYDVGVPVSVDMFKDDPGMSVGRPLLWYDYGMLKFGVVDDKVQVLSVDFQKNAQSQPAKPYYMVEKSVEGTVVVIHHADGKSVRLRIKPSGSGGEVAFDENGKNCGFVMYENGEVQSVRYAGKELPRRNSGQQ